MLYIFYCCGYFVVVTVGSSHRGCSVEKDVLGDFVDFMEEGQFSSLFSIKLQAWKPAALLSGFSCEVFASAYFKEHGERPLLYCCGFVLLFFMLWYNVPLIFNHFTCYLSISRDQLSFLNYQFSIVLNLCSTCTSYVSFFLFSLRHYKLASYKILLGLFIMYQVRKSWLHLPTA